MNNGPQQFRRHSGKRRRRKRGGAGGKQQQSQPHGQRWGSQRGRRGGAVFVGPMDHSYRQALNSGNGNLAARVPGLPPEPVLEPVPPSDDPPRRILAVLDDLFFLAKIQETARKMNVRVEFAKSEQDLLDKLGENGDAPALIIFDLNNAAAKPLATIPKLRSRLKKQTSIVGFLSHVQGDLKVKALDAGCDAVVPRSAFSQNLPQLLRRHSTAEEAT